MSLPKEFEDMLAQVFPPNPKFDRLRNEANVELIQIIAQYLTDHPTERFGQALRNLDIVRESTLPDGDIYWCNEFYGEPQDMVTRAKDALRRLKRT